MQKARIDRRLFRVFALLGVLVLIVGALAVAVNRHLIAEHEATLNRALPLAGLSAGAQASAELAVSLAGNVTAARAEAELAASAGALDRELARIDAALTALAQQTGAAAAPPDAAPARAVLHRMQGAAAQVLDLRARITEGAAALEAEGARVSALLAAQTDLARLRVTAGIADLVAAAETPAAPALDALADRDFFAFERIAELAQQAELMQITTARIARSRDPEALAADRAQLFDLAGEAAIRIDYLPSPGARRAVADALGHWQAALAPEGLVAQAETLAATERGLRTDAAELDGQISALRAAAVDLQAAGHRANLTRISADARRAERLALALATAVALALIASAALVIYARQRLLARMDRVTGRLVAVAGGDFGAPLPITGQDPIGRMEKALNVLRVRAQEARRLRHALEDAVRTRTRQLVDEIEAADGARAAAEAGAARTAQFLAGTSHEVRTALNGVIGMLSLAAADETRPAPRVRLDTALGSARDLLQITNEVLAFSATLDAPAAAASGAGSHFRLRDLIGQMHALAAPLAAQKGLALSVDLAPGAPPVLFGDAVRIRQVLTNLLSNAVKYTDRGRVLLLVDHAPDAATGAPVVSFAVADTGAGMTPDQAARAFDPYARAAWARGSGVEGAGLGLAIAQRLTEAMGGALTLETEPGVGSRFTLTVPLALGDPAQVAAAEEAPPAAARFAAQVLVVEDHPVNRMVARGFLERLGCTVTEAASATAAEAAAATGQPFDLALVDLDLPDRPGQAVIAALATARPGLTLAALTAHALAHDAPTRAGLGVAAVLSKPVSPRALAALLAQLPLAAAAPEPASERESDPDADPVRAALAADLTQIGAGTVTAMVAAFLDDLPAAIAAAGAGAPADRRRAAHRLKGAATNFRLDALCAALRVLEADPEAADPTRLAAEAEAARHALLAAAAALGLDLTAPVAQPSPATNR